MIGPMRLAARVSRNLLLLFAALCLARFVASLSAQPSSKPYVVLVSLDGFRGDYADHYKAMNILAVRDQGAAGTMVPSFPSITFPNHVSIVTGLYPEHHGIVGNSFWDAARGEAYSIQRTGADGSWYQKGTPLWVLAEQQHVAAACMFWPTCDGEIRGVRPTYWKKYDTAFPDSARVSQVIEWLKLPEQQRPHFITLYFSDVDSAGHRYGPESAETAEAVMQLDEMIGQLHKSLDRLNLPVNLILVSDHGMQTVNDGEISLAAIADSSVRVVLDGPVALIYCQGAEAIERTYARLKRDPKLDVYRRTETPAAWHFNENPRSGDLVALVKGAAVFTLHDGLGAPNERPLRGEHGYDPAQFKSMQAIFYAIGPNIARAQLSSFENVEVYPFVAKILGLRAPADLDGSRDALDAVYRP